jgi:hypothetical protein
MWLLSSLCRAVVEADADDGARRLFDDLKSGKIAAVRDAAPCGDGLAAAPGRGCWRGPAM